MYVDVSESWESFRINSDVQSLSSLETYSCKSCSACNLARLGAIFLEGEEDL